MSFAVSGTSVAVSAWKLKV